MGCLSSKNTVIHHESNPLNEHHLVVGVPRKGEEEEALVQNLLPTSRSDLTRPTSPDKAALLPIPPSPISPNNDSRLSITLPNSPLNNPIPSIWPIPPNQNIINQPSMPSSSPALDANQRGNGVTFNAETQTSVSPHEMPKKADDHWQFGPMSIKERKMNILLVFPKEDAQSDGFWWASQRPEYNCDLVSSAETAVELYLTKSHDLIVIDRRFKDSEPKILNETFVSTVKEQPVPNKAQSKVTTHYKSKYENSYFDPDTLCRSLRATKCNEFTIIMAVIKHGQESSKDAFLSHELLRAGFNKYFIENANTCACLNEIVMIEHESFLNRCKLNSVKSIFPALDHIYNAIDICTLDKEIQYVNKAFERMSEYPADELINCSNKIYTPSGLFEPIEMANKFLAKGKIWEGNTVIETKSRQNLWHHCISIPILGNKNEITQVVNVRTPINEEGLPENAYANFMLPRRASMCSLPKNIDILSSIRNNSEPVNKRRPSLARIRSMTIEAPITKVINILTNAQQSSPLTVSQALDQVLDILHSCELYTLGRGQIFPFYNKSLHHRNQSAHISSFNGANNDSSASNSNNSSFHRRTTHGPLNAHSHGKSVMSQSTPNALLDLPGSRSHSKEEGLDDYSREEDEKITADLVGNLAGISLEPRLSKVNTLRKHSTLPSNYELREVHPLLEIPDDIRVIINKDNEWDFPIFQLERLTLKRPLYYIAARIFQRFGMEEYLKVTSETIHAWLQMIESHYKQSNQYHNSTHASDVLQGTAYFLQNPLIKEVVEEHEVMGALIAATIHDLDHPGRNSAFLCNARTDLAILYNDKSVLESHHVAYGFKLTLQNDQCNIFKNLTKEEFKSLRKVVIEMVLATEMAKHFEILSKFLTFLDKCNAMVRAKKRRGTATHLLASFPYNASPRGSMDGDAGSARIFDRRNSKDSSYTETLTTTRIVSDAESQATMKSPNIETKLLQIMHNEIDDNRSRDLSTQGITIDFPPSQPVIPGAGDVTTLKNVTALKDSQDREIRGIIAEEKNFIQQDEGSDLEDQSFERQDLPQTSNTLLSAPSNLSNFAPSNASKNTFDKFHTQPTAASQGLSKASQQHQQPSTPNLSNSSSNIGIGSGGPRRSSLMSSTTKRNYWREVMIELLVGSEGEPDDGDTAAGAERDDCSTGPAFEGKPTYVSAEDAEKHRLLILNMLIKCADVSNPCRSLDLCKEWSKRIAEEYFDQTEEEKRLGLPVVMPTFDRTQCNIPQSQISFIDYFVNGMYEAWDSFCNVPELMENLKLNYKYWRIMADDVKHKRISSAQLFFEN